ncbi:MAG: CYTH domain-containing protein [Pseudobutyrivibrio sp.]|nr:CYTH domain-containing protein [Pseudobutyrivibrio sp.]
MEIEKKYLIKELPDLSTCKCIPIEQGYLSVSPVVRIRKKADQFILTYKGAGLLAREEIEASLTEEAYNHLLTKIDGNPITKKRYLIPYNQYTIELDIFEGHMAGLIMAEVEFPTLEEAENFTPPAWFATEVTEDRRYHNSNMIFGNPLT